VARSVDAVRRRIDAGMDAVIAFPGAVHGDGACAVPAALMRLSTGQVGFEHLATDASYSDARLRPQQPTSQEAHR